MTVVVRHGRGWNVLAVLGYFLVLWLGFSSPCQAGAADKALAYFSMDEAGRAEALAYMSQELGADKATQAEKDRVQKVLAAICQMAQLPVEEYTVLVANEEKFNAYALPGNILVVNRGTLEELTDGELEVILAHEVGHQVLGHPLKGLKYSTLAMSKLRQAGKKLAKAPVDDTAVAAYWEALHLSVLSKVLEKKADEWGVRLLQENHRDMSVATNLWARLRDKYGEVPYDSNHLTYKERIKLYGGKN